jgi:hypothetical protein
MSADLSTSRRCHNVTGLIRGNLQPGFSQNRGSPPVPTSSQGPGGPGVALALLCFVAPRRELARRRGIPEASRPLKVLAGAPIVANRTGEPLLRDAPLSCEKRGRSAPQFEGLDSNTRTCTCSWPRSLPSCHRTLATTTINTSAKTDIWKSTGTQEVAAAMAARQRRRLQADGQRTRRKRAGCAPRTPLAPAHPPASISSPFVVLVRNPGFPLPVFGISRLLRCKPAHPPARRPPWSFVTWALGPGRT